MEKTWNHAKIHWPDCTNQHMYGNEYSSQGDVDAVAVREAFLQWIAVMHGSSITWYTTSLRH